MPRKPRKAFREDSDLHPGTHRRCRWAIANVKGIDKNLDWQVIALGKSPSADAPGERTGLGPVLCSFLNLPSGEAARHAALYCNTAAAVIPPVLLVMLAVYAMAYFGAGI